MKNSINFKLLTVDYHKSSYCDIKRENKEKKGKIINQFALLDHTRSMRKFC